MIVRLLIAALTSGGAGAPPQTNFEDPVRLMEGETFMGAKRLYPSPVMHDVDGDKIPDMVIGDLFGKVTFAKRENGQWSGPQPLMGADGAPLKFHNW